MTSALVGKTTAPEAEIGAGPAPGLLALGGMGGAITSTQDCEGNVGREALIQCADNEREDRKNCARGQCLGL
jgi:hypothetical protein